MSEPLSSNGPPDREVFIRSWFSETAPSAFKVAALRYLADCGTAADLAAIKAELDRGDYQTTSAAVEAILRINLRDSRENAILALFELQPGSIDSSLLTDLLDNYYSGDTHRYYNVIHWLDLGVSIPRDRARFAAKIVLVREWLK